MKKQIIAAFDFDGTITYRDSLLSFFVFTTGPVKTFLYLLLKLPIMISFFFGFTSRQTLKESLLKKFFGHLSIDELRLKGEAFARTELPKKIRPEAYERIKWHQARGDRCILISASIDAYLHPWAFQNGFSDAITSEIDATPQGLVTGKLIGANCRSEEKVRRLKEVLSPLTRDNYILYAYGDSHGDKELLAFADHPFYRRMS